MLGAAIWGAGWVSGEHLKAYLANPNANVIAIGSRTKEGARARAAESGAECDVYDDLDEMLQRDDLDLVSICTPHHLHVLKDRRGWQTVWIELPAIMPDTPDVTHHPFSDEINYFVDCILNDEEPFQCVEKASRVAEVGFALELSAETNTPITLPLL